MGYKDPDDIRRPLNLFERKGVKFINDNVKEIIPSQNKVLLEKAGEISYDYLTSRRRHIIPRRWKAPLD